MPRFTLIRSDDAAERVDFVGADAGQILGLMDRLGWKSADILKDGAYLYSLSLNREGQWSLVQRLP